MSSRAGSTFATLLMSVPLAAVGLMAVFGVPPLSSVIAATRGLNDRGDRNSSEDQFEDWDSGTASEWKSGETAPEDSEVSSSDKGDSSKAPRALNDDSSTDSDWGRLSSKRSRGRSDSVSNVKDSSNSDNSPAETSPGLRPLMSGRQDSSSRPLSMKESLKKLNALGVKHYHLERGTDADTWLFVCLFAPGDEARVTHRFESESDDPDRAAEETVKQLDSWLLKRWRDKQPITQNAM